MGSAEDRALVGSLFKDPEMVKLLRDIERLRPRFWDQDLMTALEKRGKEVMRKITGSEIMVEQCPREKDDVWLAFIVKDWSSIGIPIRFTFYHCPKWDLGKSPGLHALLFEFDSLFETEKEKYRSIASRCESLAADPGFADGWYKKYSAFKNPSDGQSLGWVIEDESFDAEWIDKAVRKLGELVGQIDEELKGIAEPDA